MLQQPSPATSGRRPSPHRTTAIATVRIPMLLALAASTVDATAIVCRAETRSTLQSPWLAAHDLGACPLVAASTTNADARLTPRSR